MDKNEKYTVSEEDIEVALRYLKFNDPKNATREKAKAMLDDLQSGFHGMAHHDPERLLDLRDTLVDSQGHCGS
jgi:hypothetical protein